ncbi:AAA family ATPase [Planctomicrobium piriforme]|uniref:AAA domain-containing protein n=1 Tax=Planctomicrobium piriforme TaxID=1576369 RepID=A0A1I3EI26_9PLAN|nr:AAA family ATPase [Planctomicrobium piriforme]SFH98629.1 AAA domain-containing protein [Planctomicrobium piriforme]
MATKAAKTTKAAAPRTVILENVGPIPRMEINVRPSGITRLVAPNGSGKSLALEAVSTALKGSGKVPLRDQTKRGVVDAFGAKITLGGTCRHTGEVQVEHLEGRLDIGALIDPRLKSPAAADAARIKALVYLTGVKADATLFQKHQAFEDWNKIVDPESVKTEDLVEMARRIKADYDSAARQAEAEAEREEGHANGMGVPEDLDLSAPSDAAELAKEYDSARDILTRLHSSQQEYQRAKLTADTAQQQLDKLLSEETQPLEEATKEYEAALAARDSVDEAIKKTESRLAEWKKKRGEVVSRIDVLHERIRSQGTRQSAIDLSTKLVDDFKALSPVEDQAIVEAQAVVDTARQQVEQGAVIRQAIKTSEKAAEHRTLASKARDRAGRLRDAGRATDEVLSNAIHSNLLRIESDGKSARLVTETDRGKSTPYHELSAGERGAIAIDIAADHVGEHGILVISQEVFEGLDHDNRMKIEAKAVERNVAILTAEASQEEDAKFEVRGVE